MVVVGHLPFLDRLVALLVNGDETREILSFPEGGTACLERGLDKKWRLQWFLDPGLIP
jgi:phosphohistidine phosphatase SixA